MSGRHVENEPLRWTPVPEALLYDPKISDKAIRLYATLRRHGDDPSNCYPSKRRLASLMGCAPASLHRPTTELEEAGWISRERRFDEHGAEQSTGFYVYASPRTSSAPPARESDPPPRAGATAPRAQARDERESGNESQKNEMFATADVVRDPAVTISLAFETFWHEYPLKAGKAEARTAFARAVRFCGGDPTPIIEGARRYAADPNRDPGYTKRAQGWLNGQRWLDPPLPSRTNAASSERQRRWDQRREVDTERSSPTAPLDARAASR